MEEICELLDLIKLRIENLQNNSNPIESNENEDFTAEDEDGDYGDEENILYEGECKDEIDDKYESIDPIYEPTHEEAEGCEFIPDDLNPNSSYETDDES